MALTRELIVANNSLATLTDEQISAIEKLSANDENSVIAKKTGEIYGALDQDILVSSGVQKNGTEKTYDYAKRVIGEYKAKVADIDSLNTQISTLTKDKAKLEKTIAEGANDVETAKQLRQAKADLANITTQYNELNDKYQDAEKRHENALFGVRVDNALELATKSLTFKTGLPDSVVKVILAQTTDKIKAMNPEPIDDGNGGKVIAFKGEDGAILRNPSNQLQPYTAGELLTKELDAMGVLEKARQIKGAGTTTPMNTQSDSFVNAGGARTQAEAFNVIEQSLLAQGLTRGTDEFQDAMDKAWVANKVSKLPIN